MNANKTLNIVGVSSKLAPTVEIRLREQRLFLRGDGTVYLPAMRALFVADLHLGKDASFRSAGIPVPKAINASTLDKLTGALLATKANSIYVLGDLVHDRQSMSAELLNEFANWRKHHLETEIVLIRGNHDRHIEAFPHNWQLKIENSLILGPFELQHEIDVGADEKTNRPFQLGGHLHPVVSIGTGADHMRLPCFVAGSNSLTLPAFGPFKGGLR